MVDLFRIELHRRQFITFYHMANGWEKILSYKNKIFIVKCSQINCTCTCNIILWLENEHELYIYSTYEESIGCLPYFVTQSFVGEEVFNDIN